MEIKIQPKIKNLSWSHKGKFVGDWRQTLRGGIETIDYG